MKYSRAPSKHLDEEVYHTTVLGLPAHVTEDEIDETLAQEAQDLGLMPAQCPVDIDGIASSFSATTIASDANHHSSIISQSTAPTSCSSSEHRPTTQSSFQSDKSPPQSAAPSVLSDLDKTRDSGFRKGFRRMAGFRRRRSSITASSTFTGINREMADTANSDRMSIKSDLKGPASIKSSKSSQSSPPVATKSNYEQPTSVDNEAFKRSMDCKDMLDLHARQVEEKNRFLEYQRAVLTHLRAQHQSAKMQKIAAQQQIVAEATEKVPNSDLDQVASLTMMQMDRAVDDLESRQLAEEMKMVKEFEAEKKTVMMRLRHMEAYCQNPTPPPPPVDLIPGQASSQEQALPERKVTDRDYHSLAQQYRERDAMDDLHASKINVLRGKQKKAAENFVMKKEREIDALKEQQAREIDDLETDALKEEDGVRIAFDLKRARLESRWRLQAHVVRSKMEKMTGFTHAPLPDVVAIEDQKNATSLG